MSSALPSWLSASLASSTPWGDLVGGPHPWHAMFRMVWTDVNHRWDHDDLHRLRGYVRAVASGWDKDLEDTAWSSATNDELVRMLTGWLEGEVGRLTLARLVGLESPQQEQAATRFYLETLIRFGELSPRADVSLTERLAIPLALSAALAPGPWLLPES